jgi:hypothetical protein
VSNVLFSIEKYYRAEPKYEKYKTGTGQLSIWFIHSGMQYGLEFNFVIAFAISFHQHEICHRLSTTLYGTTSRNPSAS